MGLYLQHELGIIMDFIVDKLARTILLRRDFDYHLLRTAMIVIFLWFGYDKWFDSQIEGLAPLIEHGPLIFWTIPLLGIGGTSILLGTAEWSICLLLILGFWNKKLGVLGALGATATFFSTFTILPFMPGIWDESSGGFPAMGIIAAFLLKDLVLLCVSVYLLRQDVTRVIAARDGGGPLSRN